ncbi:calcium-binding EF-hand family protein [Actinidia rufa]|uniref:Calcium-binding EF-hand family protein n=1 Tax=Actinidia rufa TaxID=165716 RepID=A0A7J0FD38_9ERIC|nr:calcium-binding EF-hand family protein [Actinidia rufa]
METGEFPSGATHLCGVYGRKPVGVRGGGCVGAGGLRRGRGAGVGGLCEANGRGKKRKKRRLGQAKTIDECESMIAHFDLNGDGVLNFDEFRIMMS